MAICSSKLIQRSFYLQDLEKILQSPVSSWNKDRISELSARILQLSDQKIYLHLQEEMDSNVDYQGIIIAAKKWWEIRKKGLGENFSFLEDPLIMLLRLNIHALDTEILQEGFMTLEKISADRPMTQGSDIIKTRDLIREKLLLLPNPSLQAIFGVIKK